MMPDSGAPIPNPKAPASPALVYVQNEEFVATVGEPLAPASLRRILIAKWDGLSCAALASACKSSYPDASLRRCQSGLEALASLRFERADLVLLGLTFHDICGIELLRSIATEVLSHRILLVSGRRDEQTMRALRASRLDGWFDTSTEEFDSLFTALRSVQGGQGYLSPALHAPLLDRRTAGVLQEKLTPAELQVFFVIGDGSDDPEAAERLGLSPATVQTHRRNIMRKLGVTTSAKLVREAVRLGVVRFMLDGSVQRPGFG